MTESARAAKEPDLQSLAGGGPKESEPRPDLTQLTDLIQGPVDIRSLALTGLLILASVYTIWIARPFLLPIVTAVLLNFLLAPLVATLSRWQIPRALSAALVILSLLAVAGFGLYSIWEPARDWLGEAPRHLAEVETKVREAIRPVEQVGQAAAQVEKITQVGGSSKSEVKVSNGESLGESIFVSAQNLLASGAVVLGILYFLLATEDLFLRKLVRVLPRLEDKKRAVEIARQIQRDVSVHLMTITVINVALGMAVWGCMYWLEMPSPLLWGVMATALNYVPYLGAAVGVTMIGVVSLLTFDSLSQALLAPAAYVLLTSVEGTFVTPSALGRRLSLNAIVVFLGVFFWGWIWGVTGALLAVPILLVIKTFCDRIPPLAAIGEFLGR